MNTVLVYEPLEPRGDWRDIRWRIPIQTWDVNVAMETIRFAWSIGMPARLVGPYGSRILPPPFEDLIKQLPDDSQARHDRNRARWKSP